MKLSEAIKPTKWKLLISLTTIVFPLTQIISTTFLESEIYDSLFNSLPLAIALKLDFPLVAILTLEIIISQPFEPILQALGWWSNNGIFVGPNGPLLPGSFAVAITYSIIIYLTWSLISLWRSMANSTTKY